MKVCFIVPGFGGSELVTTGQVVTRLWVNYTAIALGEIGVARLDAAGTGPGSPDGRPLAALAPLEDYYSRMQGTLERGLRPLGYGVSPFGYDWRLSINTTGEQLAHKIRNAASVDEPCSIVAHSFGGIIARKAWSLLVATNQQDLVRRVITLGTGHGGSYGPVTTWTGGDELVEQIRFISGLVRGVTRIGGGMELLPEWSTLRIEILTGTWPALYQQLPVIDGLGSEGDTSRAELFELAKWPANLQLSQSHLSASRLETGEFMRSPMSFPPYAVLTTVAGLGFPTPFRLISGQTLGSDWDMEVTEDGDGRVSRASALVPNSLRYTCNVAHTDLALSPVIMANICDWVTDERTNPVPPVAEIGGGLVQPRLIAGPPWPGGQLLDVDC